MDLFGIDPGHYQANDPTANAVMDRLEDPGGCSKQLITTIVSHPSQLLCLGAIDTRVIDLCDQPLVRQPENGTLPTSSYLVGKIELKDGDARRLLGTPQLLHRQRAPLARIRLASLIACNFAKAICLGK